MRAVKVTSIKKVARPELVCDVGIEDNHNLFVCDDPTDTPVLVHNCWSLITGDKDIAQVFDVGRVFRNLFKLAPSKKLAEEIKFKGDVHKINAAYFFGVAIENVDKTLRDSVKGVIFGLIYQQGIKGLASATGQTEADIEELVKKFLKRFPTGVKWFDIVKAEGKKNLFVESPLGRRRHLWGHLTPKGARNFDSISARTTRQSVNSPVQGLGSDYLIIGAREIERLKHEHTVKHGKEPDFHLCNSVHDSIEIDCAYEDVWTALDIVERGLTDEVAKRVKERYGQEFTVPLEIDFEIGPTGKHVQEWDYDINTLQGIIKESLRFQKKYLDHNVDTKALYDHVFTEQYKFMPKWAQKQAWNKGMKMSGMKKDPRSKKEVLKTKNKPILMKGMMTDIVDSAGGARAGTGMNTRME